MTTSITKYLICFLVILIFSCSKKRKVDNDLILQSNYDQILDIVSIADCDSPYGKYVTEVRSFSDGSCFFFQKFADTDAPFIVKLDSLNNGYIINEKELIIDTLSRSDVEMIRGHEIHKMSINPRYFFDSIVYEKQIAYLNYDHQLFSGIDKLNNPVKILYNEEKNLISKIELQNARDATQLIEIIIDKWEKSKYGDLVKEIRIIQAKKDTFYFHFKSLKVRDKTSYNSVYNTFDGGVQ